MVTEILNIFDEHQNPIGTATRDEVHRHGFWHETFHCWFLSNDNGTPIVYLQQRSPEKKDYPGLFDITAAGHLLSTETAQDGVREVAEETGIEVTNDELHSLGVVPYSIEGTDMIDNEFAHVFLHHTEHGLNDFRVQPEEVAGMSQVTLQDFVDLWRSKVDEIQSTGFELTEEGTHRSVEHVIRRSNFVPHLLAYFESVIRGMKEYC